MSAVPKKKLCWNCEGNVSRDINNCPYCGVYLHGEGQAEEDSWNPSYRLMPLNVENEALDESFDSSEEPEDAKDASKNEKDIVLNLSYVFQDLKKEVLPLSLLLSGFMFAIFGLVLLLFSRDGFLTLQWNGNLWPLFLFGAIPLVYLGYYWMKDKEERLS